MALLSLSSERLDQFVFRGFLPAENEAREKAWKETTSRGGKSAWAPREEKDDFGIYRTSAIYTYGETLHVFVDRDDYKGAFAPTYKPLKYEVESTGLAAIDHIVGNVQLGKMNDWVNFYHQVMGFRQLMHFDDKDISTEFSTLMSKVMQNGNGRVKFPINEPAEGKKKSQIEEYLDYYLTPGVGRKTDTDAPPSASPSTRKGCGTGRDSVSRRRITASAPWEGATGRWVRI